MAKKSNIVKYMKFYALFANDMLYDDNERLSTVEGWFTRFSHALNHGEIPHRWFSQFFENGKLIPIKLEIKEFDSVMGRNLRMEVVKRSKH